MGMNCGYAGSKPGILKIVTVVIGFIIWAWMIAYITGAPFFKDESVAPEVLLTEETCIKLKDGLAEGKIIAPADTAEKARYEAPCPRKWFAQMAFGFAFFSFLGSVISLILLLLVELNKNGGFNTIDYIGHFVAGGLLIVATILTGCYAIMAYTKSPSCKDGRDKDECNRLVTKHYEVFGFCICAGLILVNAVLYIMVGIAVKKQKN